MPVHDGIAKLLSGACKLNEGFALFCYVCVNLYTIAFFQM